jgi:hypothetical protein
MRVLPQRTIDALGLQVEVRGQPAKWSGRVARETTPARKRRTTRPFVPCRRRHERSYRHALPSPGVCPPGVPLPSSGSSQGRIPGTFLGRKPAGLSARWGARPDPIAGPRSHPSPLPHSARDTASQRRLAGSRNGRRAVVRPRAIDSHLAPASVENSSRAAAIAFHGGCRTKVRRRAYVVGFSNSQAGTAQGAFAAPQPAVVTRPASEPPLSVSPALWLCATASFLCERLRDMT